MNTQTAAKQAIEAEGSKAAPKTTEVKRTRFDRRLEQRKKEILDKLVLEYFKTRSTFSDPDGNESVQAFDDGEQAWRWECKTFNRGRHSIKLRYEAFSESVEFYLNMEKKQINKTKEENKVKDFDHWLRRRKVWKTTPLTSIWYWIISFGNREKWLNHMKNYYKSLQSVKTV